MNSRGEAFVRRTIRFALDEEDMANLRLGIAGCGGIAGSHIEAIMEVGGADIVAVTDCLPDAARAAATTCAGSPEITTQE